MKWHLVFWILLLAAILGFGWYKHRENELDRVRQEAWRERVIRLESESIAESNRAYEFIKGLYPEPDAKQRAEAHFNHGEPFELQPEGIYEVATWTHPEYGFEAELTFFGDRLASTGMKAGSVWVTSVNPQPPRFALGSRTETLRQFIARYIGIWLWLAAGFTMMFSRRFGLFAAEVMLAVSLAYCTANLVAPNYSLTLTGVLTNDPMFLAAVMYYISLMCLAYRLAQQGYRPSWRFSVRTILLTTTLVAILLAMGRFGVVALGVLTFSSPVFFMVCHMFARHFAISQSKAVRLRALRAMNAAYRASR